MNWHMDSPSPWGSDDESDDSSFDDSSFYDDSDEEELYYCDPCDRYFGDLDDMENHLHSVEHASAPTQPMLPPRETSPKTHSSLRNTIASIKRPIAKALSNMGLRFGRQRRQIATNTQTVEPVPVPVPGLRPGPSTEEHQAQRVQTDQFRALRVVNPAERTCPICTNVKPVDEFPVLSVTITCAHPPRACLECIQQTIRADLDTKLWTELKCPECPEKLDYHGVQRLAAPADFERYDGLVNRATLNSFDNFRECIAAGCDSGQLHETGAESPIMVCIRCSRKQCFTHRVAWHEGMSCDEYDEFLKDHEKFRGRVEVDNPVAEEKRETARRCRRDENRSKQTILRSTKPCPKCEARIEKNSGCDHMTCAKCKFEFCWDCGVSHTAVKQGDNSLHKKTCKYHAERMDPGQHNSYPF